jgi:hypothetical protein
MGLDTGNILFWILRYILWDLIESFERGLSLFQDIKICFIVVGEGEGCVICWCEWPELFQAGDNCIWNVNRPTVEVSQTGQTTLRASCCGWRKVGCGERCLPLLALSTYLLTPYHSHAAKLSKHEVDASYVSCRPVFVPPVYCHEPN